MTGQGPYLIESKQQPPSTNTLQYAHFMIAFQPSRGFKTDTQARMSPGNQGAETTPPAGSRVGHHAVHKQQQRGRLQRGGSASKGVPSETFINILGMRERVPKSDPVVRAQALWDEGCGRRPYNIVSGTQLPLPTAKAERPSGRLGHPSQQSLERGRNLQASLISA